VYSTKYNAAVIKVEINGIWSSAPSPVFRWELNFQFPTSKTGDSIHGSLQSGDNPEYVYPGNISGITVIRISAFINQLSSYFMQEAL